MEWYRQFLRKFGFAGFLLSFLAVSYVFFLLLFAGIGADRFNNVFDLLSVPGDFSLAIRQPWSFITYWFVSHPLAFWQVLVEMVILYTFGHILNAMLGDHRVQGIVLFTIALNALLSVTLANLLPTIDITPTLRMYGFATINATLIGAAITLVPKYNFRVLFWDIPLIAIGIFILLISCISHMAIFALGGLSVIVGAITGIVLITLMRRGIDPTKWLQFKWTSKAETRSQKAERAMAEHRVQVRYTDTNTQPVARPKISIKSKAKPEEPMLSDEEELNLLLDKISDVGYKGLSRKEKERLDKLSGK